MDSSIRDTAILDANYLWGSIDRDFEIESAIDYFEEACGSILRLGGPWTFWAEWYDRAMAGDPLPWDLQRKIAVIPHDIWEAGPEAVAKRIREIEDEYYGPSKARPDSVPEIEKTVLRQLAEALLSTPSVTADMALSSAANVEQAITEYLNGSGENCLPEEFRHLDALPAHFRRVAKIACAGEASGETVEALGEEIEALNARVAALEADLADALTKTLNGRFKQAAIDQLAKTVTGPVMMGALAYGTCHFFGWTPANWTLSNLRDYAEQLLGAAPAPPGK